MPGYQAFSFTRRTSAATAKLLLCRLTENVGVIPLFSCLEIRFCQLFARFVSRIPFLYYAVHFWLPFVRKKSKQNVNSVNRLSSSSLCVVVMFPRKTSVPCARVRNDRNWREKTKYSIQSTRCHVCRRGASPCLIVSSLLTAGEVCREHQTETKRFTRSMRQGWSLIFP